MARRAEVLAALGRALATDEALTFVAPDRRGRRSTVYFVGLQADPGRCRWVVKAPNVGVVREDLPSPVAAEAQLAALARAAVHLTAAPGNLAAPRPVGLLAGLDSYAMEYADGQPLSRRISPAAVVRPGELLAGMAAAAELIRALHRLEPGRDQTVDLRSTVRQASRRARAVLAGIGLTAPDPPPPAADHVIAADVLLHGDFAPENVLLGASTTCLEPDLAARGPAEHDLARFLTMLFEAPLFVVGAHSARVQRLRRRAARAFLDAHYAGAPVSPLLAPLLHESLAARCVARYVDCERRRPAAHRLRLHLLRSHFGRLLRESWSWSPQPAQDPEPGQLRERAAQLQRGADEPEHDRGHHGDQDEAQRE